MCFSATASFVAGAALIPLGAATLRQAWRTDRRYAVLAAFPALFGVQQMAEGLQWRRLESEGAGSTGAGLVFLFFAYFLWPLVTPLAAALVEARAWRRRMFLVVAAIGGVFGASLFVPLLIYPAWLDIEALRHSIDYDTRLIYDGWLPALVPNIAYGAIVCLPLLASSVAGVRVFGAMMTLAGMVTVLLAVYAFTSVWCYFAAFASAHVALVVMRLPEGGRPRPAAR